MADAVIPDEDLVWNKEELKKQIRSLEHKIFIAQKQRAGAEMINAASENLKSAADEFSKKNYIEAEKYVIDLKKKKNQIFHTLSVLNKFYYIVSSWGLVPIFTAIFTIVLSFIMLIYRNSFIIIGVPLWAPLIAVIGASIQILVGVVNDYKENSTISRYKRLWYLVLPVVGFVFGFIAFLLIQGGLVNINLGQVSLNQANISELPASLRGESPIGPSAFSIILCFLAGYSTDWFMGILGKLAPAK